MNFLTPNEAAYQLAHFPNEVQSGAQSWLYTLLKFLWDWGALSRNLG
jgi:hypothetical protein